MHKPKFKPTEVNCCLELEYFGNIFVIENDLKNIWSRIFW